MGHGVSFVSRIAVDHFEPLERLLFFNGCQQRVIEGIVDAINKYGPPEIQRDDGWLRVRIAGLPDVQALFAVDNASGKPIGIAVYVRADLEHISVLHVGLDEKYCAGGEREGQKLLLRLIREVQRSSRRVKGVRRLSVHYGTQRSPRAQA
jgi:hypothetical protein